MEISEERLVRQAGAYNYLDDKFNSIHITSVPINDEEALDYFRIILNWYPNDKPKYILKRELDSNTFKMMPYRFDWQAEKVYPIKGGET